MAKLKILFVSESLSIGGAEKALLSILKLLDYSKLDVTLKLISKSGGFVKELDGIYGLKVDYVVSETSNPIVKLLNAIKIKAIYHWLPASATGHYLCKGYDVVIAFCEGYLTKWVAASTVRCRKIAWIHTDMIQNDWPLNTGVFRSHQEEAKAYCRFDEIVAISKIVANGIANKFKCATPVVIYNILDCDIKNKAKKVIPPVRSARLNIVSVGRLEYVKGYDMLVDAMNILVNRLSLDVHLCLVGDGSLRTTLEQKIYSYCLQDHIALTGIQTNPYPYMAAADLFVCPSRQEGFNIAILEAMTLGKPVISTNCAGPSEILFNGKYGLLIDSTVDDLVKSISQLYGNDEELLRLSELAIDRSKFYSSDTQLGSLYKIIEL